MVAEVAVNGKGLGQLSDLELELGQNRLDPLKLGMLGQGEGHLLLWHFQLLAHARDVAHNPISERLELLNGFLQLLPARRRLSNGVGRDRIKTGAGHGGSSLSFLSLLASCPANASPLSTGRQSGAKNEEGGFLWQWRAPSPPTASQKHREH